MRLKKQNNPTKYLIYKMMKNKNISPELQKAHQIIEGQRTYREKPNHLHRTKELIGTIFDSNNLSEKTTNQNLKKYWQKTMDTATVKRTKDIFLRQNTLYLKIDSCVLRNELSHKKTELLKKLQKINGSKIKKIVFI